ncbi:MAG: insulinase family protein [Bdellovibrionaceae bacterium]|nr:insulinase family protein [Pseudobdellovibrionaceae bacterium]
MKRKQAPKTRGRSEATASVRFQKSTLSNGVRVVTEHHPFVQSLSIGVWVMSGTRDEDAGLNGISHFLEHLVFKGTKKRSAYQIARSLEEVGGELNAFTTREYTCYHATVLQRDWRLALDVLADLVTNMKIKPRDFEKEREVILEEILMAGDDPEDLAYDLFLQKIFPRHQLGKMILGTEKSLAAMKLSDIVAYYRERYQGKHLIISAAGALDHDDFVAEVESLFGRKPSAGRMPARRAPKTQGFAMGVNRPTEQLHLLMGVPCPSFRDPSRFASFLINAWLGGGMTSHLYQKVREKRGLVYSIYSALHTFTDAGMMNIGASAAPAKMADVVEEVFDTMLKLSEKGMTEREIRFYQRQIEGSLRLGAEDVENRMNSLAINEMVFGAYRPVQQVIEEINQVTEADIRRALKQWRDKDLGVLFVGANAESVHEWYQGARAKGRLRID